MARPAGPNEGSLNCRLMMPGIAPVFSRQAGVKSTSDVCRNSVSKISRLTVAKWAPDSLEEFPVDRECGLQVYCLQDQEKL